MRTTLTLDDDLMAQLKEMAYRQGLPLKQVVNRALRAGLRSIQTPPPRAEYRMTTYSMGAPLLPSLDKALEIAATLEDGEIARKLALHK